MHILILMTKMFLKKIQQKSHLSTLTVNYNWVVPDICIIDHQKLLLAKLNELLKLQLWLKIKNYTIPRTTFSASRIVSSGMFTKGSWMHKCHKVKEDFRLSNTFFLNIKLKSSSIITLCQLNLLVKKEEGRGCS